MVYFSTCKINIYFKICINNLITPVLTTHFHMFDDISSYECFYQRTTIKLLFCGLETPYDIKHRAASIDMEPEDVYSKGLIPVDHYSNIMFSIL